MAAASDGDKINASEIYTLQDIHECFDLPKWVEVTGGKDVGSASQRSCNIQKGNILMLRTLAVDSVTLSFNDTETGIKRLVNVSPDSQVKFTVLLPAPDFKNPSRDRTVYKTVNDLLKVCPTYFKANVFYDDPYLPAIVKSGEVFRFIRQIRRTSDRRPYLQCEDPGGNVVELPGECRGDFTAVEDDNAYTLTEILDMGAVNRKLRLSHQHMALAEDSDNKDAYYSNLCHSDGSNILQRIMGLPLTYTGLISLHKPNVFLAASPAQKLQEVWRVPLDLAVNVRQFFPEEYETPANSALPIQKMYKLSELVDTYNEDFPVLATVVYYKDMPSVFRNCLEPGMDVIIHDIERDEKMLAKSDGSHYCIARDMAGAFRKTLKKFKSLSEVKASYCEGDDLKFKILQDVASDFPVPFSLQAGDVIKFKTLQTKMHKVKTKSKKTYGPFCVLQCSRRLENGAYEKILLPDDLEIWLHEMPPSSKVNGFSVHEVFQYKPELPFNVDYLADYSNLWSCLPVQAEIELTNFITEPLVIMSPVFPPADDADAGAVVDARIKTCIAVPARHHVMLTVKETLGFPPNYFRFPDRRVYMTTDVEKISRSAFDDLISHNDMAYEEYEYGNLQQTTVYPKSDIQLPVRAIRTQTTTTEETMNKRISRSFSNLFKVKKKPAFFNKLRRKSGIDSKSVTMAVGNETYQPGSEFSDDTNYDDESVYETYHFSNGDRSDR